MLIDILIVLAIFAFIVFLWLVYTRAFGAEFIETPKHVRKAISEILKLNKKDIFYDLGSGIGSLLLEVSPKVKEAIGIEIDPIRFLIAYLKIRIKRVKNVKLIFGNIFNKNLNNATKIFVFLSKEANEKLGKKLNKETKNAIVVSYKWPIKNLKLIKVDKENGLYKHKV
ncbi:MAG: SAM-dependent methyltransferase [Candidatus Pacearchaeota archaeon]